VLSIFLASAARRLAPEAAEAARRRACHAAKQSGYTISAEAVQAAEWVMLVTSLPAPGFGAEDILDLYRLRWRVELAFKRLKSVGLNGPPGKDPTTAQVLSWRTY
jgi:IS4 transposase